MKCVEDSACGNDGESDLASVEERQVQRYFAPHFARVERPKERDQARDSWRIEDCDAHEQREPDT